MVMKRKGLNSARLIFLAMGSLSTALVAIAVPAQAISEDVAPGLAPISQSPLLPQPVDASANAAPQPLDLPPPEPVFPDVEWPVRLVIRLSDRRVYVYRGNDMETSFPVAVGRPGWETPTGEFQVFNKLENPGWTNPFTDEVVPPGPHNPLGERWIAFWTDGTNQIGFHGTPNTESVGSAASHGCIRLYNEHIHELYQLVDIGTSVTVEP